LKTSKIKEDIATKNHFKLIIEPLQKIVDSSIHTIKDKPRDDVSIKTSFSQKDMIRSKIKEKQENTSVDHVLSKSHKLMRHTSNDMMDSPAIMSTPRMTIEAAKPTNEDVFEAQTIRSRRLFNIRCKHCKTSQHLGLLGQEYIGDCLSDGRKNKIIDNVHSSRLG